MCNVCISSVLVLALAVCCNSDRGVVLKFTNSGDFNFLISNHENDGKPLEEFWIKKGVEDFIQVSCGNYDLNIKTKNVISQNRANLLTKDGVELDSLQVRDCVKQSLVSGIVVTQTRDDTDKKEYDVFFKDVEGQCCKRHYQVDVITDDVGVIYAVTRSTVEVISYGFRSKCQIGKNVAGLVTDWYDDGMIHDYGFPDEYTTNFQLTCPYCRVLCKVEDKDNAFVDIIFENVPLDRVKVSSCTKISLQISIKVDLHSLVDERYKGVYIDYLKTDGSCYVRKYKYDVQYHRDPMLQRVYVSRDDPVINIDCKTMKAKGLVRGVGKMAAHHVGRVTNKLLRWRSNVPDDDKQEETTTVSEVN